MSPSGAHQENKPERRRRGGAVWSAVWSAAGLAPTRPLSGPGGVGLAQAYFAGLGLCLGLIAAIGAQNAFVLRQGLRRAHVLPVVLTCALSDTVLIVAGVTGFGALADRIPAAAGLLRWGGVLFLVVYGALSFRRALRGGEALEPAGAATGSRARAIATALAFTWLNPHVYLDTVVLLGSIAADYDGRRPAFAAGAVSASFLFFFTLGYGARLMRPLFASPRAWQGLDAAVALLLWAIALTLAL